MQCRGDKCLHWDDRSKQQSASKTESEKGRDQAAAEGETWDWARQTLFANHSDFASGAPCDRLGGKQTDFQQSSSALNR